MFRYFESSGKEVCALPVRANRQTCHRASMLHGGASQLMDSVQEQSIVQEWFGHVWGLQFCVRPSEVQGKMMKNVKRSCTTPPARCASPAASQKWERTKHRTVNKVQRRSLRIPRSPTPYRPCRQAQRSERAGPIYQSATTMETAMLLPNKRQRLQDSQRHQSPYHLKGHRLRSLDRGFLRGDVAPR